MNNANIYENKNEYMKLNANWYQISFGNLCNLHCSYCFENRLDRIEYEYSDLFEDYLNNLISGSNSISIRYFGGEPLLHWGKIKYLIPKYSNHVQSIITNGKLLDDEIVDICNKYNIGVTVSTDGPSSINTRKYDILKDKEKVELLKKIHNLDLSITIPDNVSCMTVYSYIHRIIPRQDINYYMAPQDSNTTMELNRINVPFEFDTYAQSKSKNMDLFVVNNPYVDKYISNHKSNIACSICTDLKIRTTLTNNIIGELTENGAYIHIPTYKKEMNRYYNECAYTLCIANEIGLCNGGHFGTNRYRCFARKASRAF